MAAVRGWMAKAYSLDLRQKVFAAYQAGEQGQEQVAALWSQPGFCA